MVYRRARKTLALSACSWFAIAGAAAYRGYDDNLAHQQESHQFLAIEKNPIAIELDDENLNSEFYRKYYMTLAHITAHYEDGLHYSSLYYITRKPVDRNTMTLTDGMIHLEDNPVLAVADDKTTAEYVIDAMQANVVLAEADLSRIDKQTNALHYWLHIQKAKDNHFNIFKSQTYDKHPILIAKKKNADDVKTFLKSLKLEHLKFFQLNTNQMVGIKISDRDYSDNKSYPQFYPN